MEKVLPLSAGVARTASAGSASAQGSKRLSTVRYATGLTEHCRAHRALLLLLASMPNTAIMASASRLRVAGEPLPIPSLPPLRDFLAEFRGAPISLIAAGSHRTWRAAKARVRADGGALKVLVVGASVTAGVRSFHLLPSPSITFHHLPSPRWQAAAAWSHRTTCGAGIAPSRRRADVAPSPLAGCAT